MNNNSKQILEVAILGAGISGLGMAVNLLRAKNTSFLIFEKNEASHLSNLVAYNNKKRVPIKCYLFSEKKQDFLWEMEVWLY